MGDGRGGHGSDASLGDIMGNIRSQRVNHSQVANDQAAVNGVAAASATNIPTLRDIVADNSATIQELVLSNQRLERLVDALMRRNRRV